MHPKPGGPEFGPDFVYPKADPGFTYYPDFFFDDLLRLYKTDFSTFWQVAYRDIAENAGNGATYTVHQWARFTGLTPNTVGASLNNLTRYRAIFREGGGGPTVATYHVNIDRGEVDFEAIDSDLAARKARNSTRYKFPARVSGQQDARDHAHKQIAYILRRGEISDSFCRRTTGLSYAAFRQHIESRFASGMTWKNRGAWHIDHVRPLADFDLSDPRQVAEANHYSNLAPLWAADNRRKGSRR